MAIAERFRIGPGEKALVIGCKQSDFESWLRKNPVMNERIDFMSEDDLSRAKTTSTRYKGILSCRHINHSDNGRFGNLIKKSGIYYRFFPRSLDLKTFLEFSVLITPKAEVKSSDQLVQIQEKMVENMTAEVIPPVVNEPITISIEPEDVESFAKSIVEEPIVEEVVEKVAEKEEVTSTMKNKKRIYTHPIQDFVLANADFSAEPASAEITRLVDLASRSNLGTKRSIEVCYYKFKKLNRETSPVSVIANTTKKVKEVPVIEKSGNEKVVQDFFDKLKGFSASSFLVINVFNDLQKQIEGHKNQINLYSQLDFELREKIRLMEQEIKRLKEENIRQKADFKNEIADKIGRFMKELK